MEAVSAGWTICVTLVRWSPPDANIAEKTPLLLAELTLKSPPWKTTMKVTTLLIDLRRLRFSKQVLSHDKRMNIEYVIVMVFIE